ncbi:acetate kinase [Pediococcus damnosus LMG 28219]|uniref:acetate/propionate family kinase n=1 Tax=Pediococcus damnosus TaxID=51663 RepID=UPI0006201C36|nr:acetate kinase [Pediococcus damnosus]AMV69653.1 Acetate kinase [Pediococcus damnosus]KJU75171.1 acetate kinase [Pediococcus damnosus LMG 28219]PIO85080.1 acetate kinase [Pediococcus damnosus]GEA92942.1 acetate kinase [Pediococcus damnosus]
MKKILVINAGSSSLKWQLFNIDDLSLINKGVMERMNTPEAIFTIVRNGEDFTQQISNLTYKQGIELLFDQLKHLHLIDAVSEIAAVGHRVVAGATIFKHPTQITSDNIGKLKALNKYAPLHNPVQVECIETLMDVLPDTTPQIAVFDSQFYLNMPEETALYAIPYDYSKKYHIRKYGEHGISHEYVLHETANFLKKDYHDLKLVTLHLGGGASITASQDGKPFDTSMGFTPLEGLPMGTRSGSVDPAVVPFLMNELHMTADQIIDIFNKKSGLLGVSGISADMRDIVSNSATNPRAKLAYDMFINSAVKYIGGYFTEMGGLDVITFTAGIGEHQASLRTDVINRLAVLGIKLDENRNQNGKGPRVISSDDSSVQVLMIPTNEELAIARSVKKLTNEPKGE